MEAEFFYFVLSWWQIVMNYLIFGENNEVVFTFFVAFKILNLDHVKNLYLVVSICPKVCTNSYPGSDRKSLI